MVGSAISHYNILAKLGEGGMGVVYKAEDTRLERQVALKFLPSHLLGDADVKKRFQREAKAAAALDHANICTVHEIDEADGKTFIAMALLEGESLDKRIVQGPLKLEDVLAIAGQIANGLEAAHEKGIHHRDIKPENVMVDAKGHVTIMDFGLAQLSESSRLTRTDETVGTVAYMSPEQTQGSGVDHRTYIWSLGVVIYEMVTGEKPFKGAYDKAVMYSILNEEHEPITAVRAGVPMELEVFVGKCLAKDPADRYDSASDLAKDLRSLSEKLKSGKSTILPAPTVGARHVAPSASGSVAAPQRSQRVLQFSLVLAVLALLGVLALHLSEAPPEQPVRRFSFTPELLSGPVFDGAVRRAAISPDGRWIVYVSEDPSALWLRPIDSEEPRMLEGTEGAQAGMFWSPDGRFVGFATESALKKIAIAGGTPTVLAQLKGGVWAGGCWSADGETIVFDFPQLYEVSAQGGEPRELVELLSDGIYNHEPHFLPGRVPALLFTVGGRAVRDIYLRNLEMVETVMLVEGANPVYSQSGHILYQTAPFAGELWALPFSVETLKVAGEPFLVAKGVADASVATDGTLVTVDQLENTDQRLVWRDRQGRQVGEVGQPQHRIKSPALSPDGQQVAVGGQEDASDNGDIWIHQVDRAVKQRLTFDEPGERNPSWSPGGDKVAFRGRGGIFVRAADGGGEAITLVGGSGSKIFAVWSPDSSYLMYAVLVPETLRDLWLFSVDERGEAGEPKPFLVTPSNERYPQISPDGRFVAYTSDESGESQVLVRRFPGGGGRWQVSTDVGRQPRWSRDGKELFYVDNNKWLVAVEVNTSPNFTLGEAEYLFTAPC